MPVGRMAPRGALLAALVLVCLSLGSIAAGPGVLRSGHNNPLRLTAGQASALLAEKAGPTLGASSGILVDRPSGTVLWAKNPDAARAPASTTKMMTVLAATESLEPDQMVTVPAEALVGGTTMGLKAGERLSVRDLLYGALLPSGNDAATALAIAAGGDERTFVQRMNEHAAEWGLTATHFANPHGLDEAGHVSSARDLAQLGLRTLADPLLASIVRKPQARIGERQLTNTNDLLTTYDGAYGVKTGTTDNAGQVLVAAAARTDGDALTVVMNSPDRFVETRRLLDFYFEHWQSVDARLGGDVLSLVHAPDGVVYVAQTPSAPLLVSRWQGQNLRFFRDIHFDAQNQPSGVLQTWLGPDKLAETPMTFQPLYLSSAAGAATTAQ